MTRFMNYLTEGLSFAMSSMANFQTNFAIFGEYIGALYLKKTKNSFMQNIFCMQKKGPKLQENQKFYQKIGYDHRQGYIYLQ